jgi:hypothetical protein
VDEGKESREKRAGKQKTEGGKKKAESRKDNLLQVWDSPFNRLRGIGIPKQRGSIPETRVSGSR